MVEGHGCHRVAHFHRQQLLNRKFKASSPNGRFADGAAKINNQELSRIEVHGKNLFYFFGTDPTNPEVVMWYHFGMAGAFGVFSPPHEPKPTTRLELLNQEENIVAHLSAMIVEHGDLDFYHSKIAKLGEDPLRDNANPEIVWEKVNKSKKPIGLLLMDQSVVAGIGNIYRAEILFKAGVHPEQPGYTISRSTFDVIWQHSVELLQRGFQTGSILTVDPEEAAVLGQPWTRRYVYNHSKCGRCGTKIMSWDMANRTVYCCTTCQPLSSDGENETTPVKLPAARLKAMAQAHQAVEFISHCAPDDVDDSDTPLSKLTVAALRKRAEAAVAVSKTGDIGQLKTMKKPELVALLEEFEKKNGVKKEVEKDSEDFGVIKTPLPANKRKKLSSDSAAVSPTASPTVSVKKKVRPGTAGLVGKVATAREAAIEKARAGENRAVEHVALHDEEEELVLKKIGGGGVTGSKVDGAGGKSRRR